MKENKYEGAQWMERNRQIFPLAQWKPQHISGSVWWAG